MFLFGIDMKVSKGEYLHSLDEIEVKFLDLLSAASFSQRDTQ